VRVQYGGGSYRMDDRTQTQHNEDVGSVVLPPDTVLLREGREDELDHPGEVEEGDCNLDVREGDSTVLQDTPDTEDGERANEPYHKVVEA